MDKLKPCPFCGGKAIITVLQHRFTDLYFCSCEKCHISQTSGEYTFRQEAINAWNKRSNDASVRHGHWIKDAFFSDEVNNGEKCSQCGELIGWFGNLPKYCPGCGALMDGGKDNG